MVDDKKLRKVLKLVAEYNRIAEKNGHPKIRYNVFKHIVCDVYRRRSWMDAKTSLALLRIMYINWKLDRLYDKIWCLNLSLLGIRL